MTTHVAVARTPPGHLGEGVENALATPQGSAGGRRPLSCR